jgi:hypothetical protein
MIWLHFEEMMAGIAASMARTEADAVRADEKARSYKGPWRRKSDAVDVEARVVDDPLALPGQEEIAP